MLSVVILRVVATCDTTMNLFSPSQSN